MAILRRILKSKFASCVLGACAVVVLSQACGSDDGKQSRRAPSAEGGESGAAGESSGLAGEKPNGTSGNGGSGGAVGESGAPSVSGTSSEAGAGTDPQGGTAGEGAQGNAGAGVQGGEAGAGGAGESVTCELAATCTGDLSAVGTGDFSIAFTLTTTTTARSGVISQRATCMHSKFWDVRLGTLADQSALSIELDDQSNYTSFAAPATLNDGEPHEVRICRKAGHVYAFSDGVLVGDALSQTSFTTLPALTTSTTTCNALDGTVTLDGSVTAVCVGAL